MPTLGCSIEGPCLSIDQSCSRRRLFVQWRFIWWSPLSTSDANWSGFVLFKRWVILITHIQFKHGFVGFWTLWFSFVWNVVESSLLIFGDFDHLILFRYGWFFWLNQIRIFYGFWVIMVLISDFCLLPWYLRLWIALLVIVSNLLVRLWHWLACCRPLHFIGINWNCTVPCSW